jgi:hypothetical protein
MSGNAKLSVRVFEDKSPIHRDTTTVYWRYISGEPLTAFHCPYCTAMLFKFRGRLIIIKPGDSPVEEVVRLMCPNKNCQMQYSWVEYELVSPVASSKY